jgi:23S rRNA (cytosine1962-C5)-methyltransferase
MPLDDLRNRLRRNARHWGRWARRRAIECYRVYDRDVPEFAWCLDLYGGHAHLQEYRRATAEDDKARSGEVVLAVADALELPVEHVHLKARTRRGEGEQHEATGRRGTDLAVLEGGLRFLVNLDAYLDTGLFLDHRNTRAMVRAEARGKRFLNLFCYTGSFTVYAAAGGAASSLSVDLSNTYLDWADRNLALNAIDRDAHRLLRADVLAWLASGGDGGPYDLIVLDPPSFSTSKAMAGVLDVQRDHAALIAHCAALLASGGVLYFSTNLRTFSLDPGACAGMAVTEVSARTVPEDFRNRRIHRCWRMTKA